MNKQKEKVQMITRSKASKINPHETNVTTPPPATKKKSTDVKKKTKQPKTNIKKKTNGKVGRPRKVVQSESVKLSHEEQEFIEVKRNEAKFKNLYSDSKTGVKLSDYQRNLIEKLMEKWENNKNVIVLDETSYLKFSVITKFIVELIENTAKIPPALIITTSQNLVKWVYELNDWSKDIKYCVIGYGKNEKKVPINQDLIYNKQKNFNVLLTTREQFVRNNAAIPKILWSFIVVDDFGNSKTPLVPTFQILSNIRCFMIISIFKNLMDIDRNDLPEIQAVIQPNIKPQKKQKALFLDILKESAIDIKIDESSNANILNEVLLLCPMTQKQQRSYLQLFFENQKELSSENIDKEFIINFSLKLRDASTQTGLVERDFSNTGKLIVLLKLLDQQKFQDRSVAIFCGNQKISKVLQNTLAEHQFSCDKYDTGSKEKYQKKTLSRFNKSNGFSIIIVTSDNPDEVLHLLTADTIILFDSDWSPLMNSYNIIKWLARSDVYPPQIIHLITKSSFEHVFFCYYWHHRKENNLEEYDEDVLMNLIKINAKLLKDSETVRGTAWASQILKEAPLINFHDKDALIEFEEEHDFPEDFFETVKAIQKTVIKLKSSKSIPIQEYWKKDQIIRFINELNNFGFGRWNKFNAFGRNKTELVKLALSILKSIDIDSNKYENVHLLLSQITNSEFRKFTSPIKDLNEAISSIDKEKLFDNIEMLTTLSQIFKETPVILEGTENVPKLSEDWTKDDDIELLTLVWENGLYNIPDTFYPELNQFFDSYIREILKTVKDFYKRINQLSTIIKLPIPRRLNISSHNKIINGLMLFGFPNIEYFYSMIDVNNYSIDEVQKYVDSVLKYCMSSSEERKSILPLLADKIPKYTILKINKRIKLFEQIRAVKNAYYEYPAEDLEYFTAIAHHGLGKNFISPTLMVSCMGNCSEIKLYSKVKLMFSENNKSRKTQKIPDEVYEMSPLRINDMIVILNLGEIDSRPDFSNKDYVYPLGFKSCCVCPSPINPEFQIWVECTITEENGKPYFIINDYKSIEHFHFEGNTPDEPFEQLRSQAIKKLKKFIPPFNGHEMYGLTSAIFHRLLINMPGIEHCPNYVRRFFCTNFQFINQWPVIGQFEKEPEKQTINNVNSQASKFKFKKKTFGDILPPLVINLNPLYLQNTTNIFIDINSNSNDLISYVNGMKNLLKDVEPISFIMENK